MASASFDAAFQQGTRGGDKYFTVFARATKVGKARLGIAVSKRNLRLAVERNRIKRLVRESFRTSEIRDLSMDIVILPRSTVKDADPARLRRTLELRWQSLRTFASNQQATAIPDE